MIRLTLLLVLLAAGGGALAGPRIAILDFELSDLTPVPNTPEERERTASLRPLLERALRDRSDYRIINIAATEQAAANASFGYLFRHHDLAAVLGRRHGAEWVLVGRHSKPSFLFSYLMVHLIRVTDRALVADYAVELKGNHEKVSRRGIKSLARRINDDIEKLQTIPDVNPTP